MRLSFSTKHPGARMSPDRLRSAGTAMLSSEHLQATAAYLLDQGVCSIGNFLISFMAARHLPSTAFGIFALLNSLIILSMVVNNWLIRTTVSETSQLGDSGETRAYTSTLAFLAALFGGVVALVAVAAACALRHPELCLPLAVVAVAAQVQELLRRSAMAQSRFRIGIQSDIVSYLGQAAILVCIVYWGQLTLQSVFWSIGLTSALSGVIQARCLGLQSPSKLSSTARLCWENGRWVTLSGLILSPLMYGMPWLLEITRGQAEVGRLSSLLLVVGLSNPVVFSSTWLILVRAQGAREATLPELFRKLLPTLRLTLLPLAALWTALFLLPRQSLTLFYGSRSPYIRSTRELQLVVLCFVAAYVATCLEVLTDSRGKTRERVRVDTWASLVMVTLGLAFSFTAGLVGVVSVCLCAHVLRAVAYWTLLAKPQKKAVNLIDVSTVEVQEVSS